MTVTTDLPVGLSIHVSNTTTRLLRSFFFLGPLEWARAETGGGDRGELWRRVFSEFDMVYQNLHPEDTHSNKNSNLRPKWSNELQQKIKTRGLERWNSFRISLKFIDVHQGVETRFHGGKLWHELLKAQTCSHIYTRLKESLNTPGNTMNLTCMCICLVGSCVKTWCCIRKWSWNTSYICNKPHSCIQ